MIDPGDTADRFLTKVQAFCIWAEGDAHTLLEARQHLVELIADIPLLLDYRWYALDEEDDENESERRGYEGWKVDQKRFSDLPFQFYHCALDPHDMESGANGMGDLFDDLADIYGELYVGLQ